MKTSTYLISGLFLFLNTTLTSCGESPPPHAPEPDPAEAERELYRQEVLYLDSLVEVIDDRLDSILRTITMGMIEEYNKKVSFNPDEVFDAGPKRAEQIEQKLMLIEEALNNSNFQIADLLERIRKLSSQTTSAAEFQKRLEKYKRKVSEFQEGQEIYQRTIEALQKDKQRLEGIIDSLMRDRAHALTDFELWEKTESINTLASYLFYIKNCIPPCERKGMAGMRHDDLLLQSSRSANNPYAYLSYFENCLQCADSSSIKREYDGVLFSKARQDNTEFSWKEYLEKCKYCERREEGKNSYDEILWSNSLNSHTIQDLTKYLENSYYKRHEEEARALLCTVNPEPQWEEILLYLKKHEEVFPIPKNKKWYFEPESFAFIGQYNKQSRIWKIRVFFREYKQQNSTKEKKGEVEGKTFNFKRILDGSTCKPLLFKE